MSRRPLDAYHTPDDLALALVSVLPLNPAARVLEPHVGGGAFVRALRALGHHGRILGMDVDPEAPGIPLCDGGLVSDFTAVTPSDVDAIVGNPPFRGFEAHVDHALAVAPNVAFLLRLAVMESAGRASMWARWPLRKVWVLAERPSFTGGGTDSAAYGWFLFQRGYTGTAEIVPGWSWKVRA